MKNVYFDSWYVMLIVSFVGISPGFSQQLAFPGAEGFGRYTTGGRGGDVYEVTNLNDSGAGSLREGVEMTGARIIIFRVSGTIHLLSELKIRQGNLTIAGQTAPGDGIALKGSGVVVDADNIIIRYLRFRPGDISGGEPDAIWGRNHSDIIIDHCSMSWAVDETSSFYDNENFTMQWCLLSESLYESQHEKGRHGYGGIWGGQGATFHHNILAHHSSRNPRFNGSRYSGEPDLEIVDYRNNVIYNWGGNSAYGGENGNHNMVSNYYKAGPATSGDKRFRILDASTVNDSDPVLGRWHIEGNYVDGYPEVTADNWNGGVQRLDAAQLEEVRYEEPFPFAPVTTQTAQEAYEGVLANSGAILPKRDPVDTRIVDEIETGTVNFGGVYGPMKGIIDSQEQVGGWPQLFSAPPPADSDHDGMPNDWEQSKALDPENPADGKIITGSGYTNLEIYLHSIDGTEYVDFLKHPTELSINEVTISSIILLWKDNEDSETAVILERSLDNIHFELLDVLPENAVSFLDEGLDAGTEYYYRLRVANESDTSMYSPTLSVTTLFAEIPQKAHEPSPANNATAVNPYEVTLSWIGDAIAYNLYTGSSADELVLEADGIETTSHTLTALTEVTDFYWRVDAVGEGEIITQGDVWTFKTGTITAIGAPVNSTTYAIFPNPFSEKINITFHLEKAEAVEISLYNVHGQKAHTLIESKLGAGEHQLLFHTADKQLKNIAEGVYFCVLKTSTDKIVQRVLFLKE